jgi:hypothetical protein
MPTKYKPQLDHVGFDWFNQSNKLIADLTSPESLVCESSHLRRGRETR